MTFNRVCHNTLLSKINRSQLPPAMAQWLSCYLRGRQAKTCFRGVKSTSRKLNTGLLQGSKLSPSLFSFYIADISRPTDPVKQVCYADILTVWASGVHILDLEVILNNYLEEMTPHLKHNSLLISATKSSVTLLSPDTHQAKTHRSILIEDSRLQLVKCPRILGYQTGTTTLEPWQVHPIYTERGSEDHHWLSRCPVAITYTQKQRC